MSGEAVDLVKKHLRESAIPMEFEAARILSAGGFEARQGRAYIGDSGPREIDILARMPPEILGNDPIEALIGVSLVAECKRTADHPWIVLNARTRVTPREVIAGAMATAQVQSALSPFTGPETLDVPDFFGIDELHGFSISVAGSKDRPAYDALAQVVSAAAGVTKTEFAWSFAWAVLVIDGDLFSVDYKPDGEPKIDQVDRARLMWHGGPSRKPTPVDIVRITALDAYASHAFRALRALQTRLYFEVRKGRSDGSS